MSMTLSDLRVVTPDEVHDGWLTIEDGLITHIGRGTAPGNGHDLDGRLVVPGFVDIHNHGGAGGSYPDGDPETAAAAAAFHLGHGTTTIDRQPGDGLARRADPCGLRPGRPL